MKKSKILIIIGVALIIFSFMVGHYVENYECPPGYACPASGSPGYLIVLLLPTTYIGICLIIFGLLKLTHSERLTNIAKWITVIVTSGSVGIAVWQLSNYL